MVLTRQRLVRLYCSRLHRGDNLRTIHNHILLPGRQLVTDMLEGAALHACINDGFRSLHNFSGSRMHCNSNL